MKEEKREVKTCDTCAYTDENGVPIHRMCEMCIDNMNWRPKDECSKRSLVSNNPIFVHSYIS